MKKRFQKYDESAREYTREPDQLSTSNDVSFHEDYSYQGDEFLDDALRMVEQAFVQGNFTDEKMEL